MTVKPVAVPVEPALLDVKDTCITLRCSKPVVYRLFEEGMLDFVMQGRRRFVTRAMINEYIARLSAGDKPKPSETVNNRWRKKGASVAATRAEINAAVKPTRASASGSGTPAKPSAARRRRSA
jgi:excisionase family DNA binding protein